jgi:methylthioribose-1-phosphate isomerase
VPLAPANVAAWNPVFDVTPAHLVDVLVTENGVIHHPDAAAISALCAL